MENNERNNERVRIATLEVLMKELMGNGQPGRIQKIEEEVKSHARLLWIGLGGLYVVELLAATGILNIHK